MPGDAPALWLPEEPPPTGTEPASDTLVDDGVRQLAAEAWMHNRLRMVVGSFLTIRLRID